MGLFKNIEQSLEEAIACMVRFGCKRVHRLLFGDDGSDNKEGIEAEAITNHLEKCEACRKRAERSGVPEPYRKLLKLVAASARML